MPRLPSASTNTNGAVPRTRGRRPAATRGSAPNDPVETFLAHDPVDPVDSEGGSSTAMDAPLREFTGSAVGAVGRPEMVPDEIQALGPNGEVIVLRRNEDGQFVTINTNVPPPPVSAEVDHPLLQQLRTRTNKPKGLVQRAPAYNHRMLWYMKPDGEVVPLQGDPGNRAYYEDKGFVVLRDEEERVYLRGDPARGIPPIRRMVIEEQRKRARLITVIRSIAKRNPSVEMTGDLSITPTEELEEMLVQLRGTQGINFRLIEARQRDLGNQDEKDDQVLSGMDAGVGHELYRKMARSREQQKIGGLHRAPSQGAADLSNTGQMLPE